MIPSVVHQHLVAVVPVSVEAVYLARTPVIVSRNINTKKIKQTSNNGNKNKKPTNTEHLNNARQVNLRVRSQCCLHCAAAARQYCFGRP